MSHNSSKQTWENMSQKERENLWRQAHGTGIIPNNITGTQIDNLLNNYEKKNEKTEIRWDSTKDDSTWGELPR